MDKVHIIFNENVADFLSNYNVTITDLKDGTAEVEGPQLLEAIVESGFDSILEEV